MVNAFSDKATMNTTEFNVEYVETSAPVQYQRLFIANDPKLPEFYGKTLLKLAKNLYYLIAGSASRIFHTTEEITGYYSEMGGSLRSPEARITFISHLLTNAGFMLSVIDDD